MENAFQLLYSIVVEYITRDSEDHLRVANENSDFKFGITLWLFKSNQHSQGIFQQFNSTFYPIFNENFKYISDLAKTQELLKNQPLNNLFRLW